MEAEEEVEAKIPAIDSSTKDSDDDSAILVSDHSAEPLKVRPMV
jgi:hypothetical protein